jgi:hypothetical protein
MKAIETRYKGYRFRSRLEARWAIFFDTCGIRWEYESEGFELDDGTWYLPDFWLPKFHGGIFAEVKPHGDEFSVARRFARGGQQILLLGGSPDTIEYELAGADGCMSEVSFSSKYLEGGRNGSEYRLYWQPAGCASEMAGDLVVAAISAARGARFESRR